MRQAARPSASATPARRPRLDTGRPRRPGLGSAFLVSRTPRTNVGCRRRHGRLGYRRVLLRPDRRARSTAEQARFAGSTCYASPSAAGSDARTPCATPTSGWASPVVAADLETGCKGSFQDMAAVLARPRSAPAGPSSCDHGCRRSLEA